MGNVGERVKGLAILGAVQALRARREEAEVLLDDSLHFYLDRTISVTSWYPEVDHSRLLEAVAELYAESRPDVWKWMGKRTAEINLDGAYSYLLNPTDPADSLTRFPDLWRRYRNSGRLDVAFSGARSARLSLADYAFLHEGIVRLLQGYFIEAMKRSGAENPKVEIEDFGGKGRPAQWSVAW